MLKHVIVPSSFCTSVQLLTWIYIFLPGMSLLSNTVWLKGEIASVVTLPLPLPGYLQLWSKDYKLESFMLLTEVRVHEYRWQCDLIGRYIGLWATFQSIWQQLICPNLLHSHSIFVKVSKSVIFLVKSFLGNFYRHLVIFYWSHWKVTPQEP